ncbi:MAG: hypothetical protein JW910_09905 [Anaerolineae bacterium]|nr:hypothetical protein [Anaerolineae bacterium]
MIPPDSAHDLPRLQAALQALFPDPAGVRRVLNLGCGAFPEANLLRQCFPAAQLLGIDRDHRALRAVPGVALLVGEGERLPFGDEVRFELVLVRHPDVDRDSVAWGRVGAAVPARLVGNGRVLVSCYAAHEGAVLRDGLLRGGAVPLALPGGLPAVDLAGRDRILLVFGAV